MCPFNPYKPHAVRNEKFYRLFKSGKSVREIAIRYAVSDAIVKKAIALGDEYAAAEISPEVDSWIRSNYEMGALTFDQIKPRIKADYLAGKFTFDIGDRFIGPQNNKNAQRYHQTMLLQWAGAQ